MVKEKGTLYFKGKPECPQNVPLLVPHVGPSNKVASDENEPEGTWCKKSRGVKYTAASQILSV